MDAVRNPFTPGAGMRPPALVGRDQHIRDMDVALQRLLVGRPARGQLLTGRRGVGKTVLLNEFERLAERHGFCHGHIEVAEDGELAGRLARALHMTLLEMDARRSIGERVRRALGVLKAFSIRLPGGPEIGRDIQPVAGPADSGDLAYDLAGLFVEVGTVARDHGCSVLLTIDELHHVPVKVLPALVLGLHRANQLGLPILVAGAALPSLPTLVGEAKSYAERMFTSSEVGSLTGADAALALVEPCRAEGVRWMPEALEGALARASGHPYFLQEFGKHAWDVSDGPDIITVGDVQRATPLALASLDGGFFQAHTGRVSEQERRYLRAMAEVGMPAKSAGVAAILRRHPRSLGPVRDRLLKKALCYAPRWGELDFTAPMFDAFVKRWLPWPPPSS
ncbi:MAG: ATP-binding protein [Chloroflexota bacterium]|nr:ATP-binding protein [Chloroflexota bacterium]